MRMWTSAVSKTAQEEKNLTGFTPSFIDSAIGDIQHRYILVLESECRRYENEVIICPPRFCVGAVGAAVDPRNVSLTKLVPLDAAQIHIPSDWVKAHEFISVVHDGTDEFGWQYRSTWPEQAQELQNELWSKYIEPNADVRWRMWMSTVVRVGDLLEAKVRISEALLSRQSGIIIESSLLILEKFNNEKKWISRRCVLLGGTIEIIDEMTGKKIDELDLLDYHIKVMKGFAFSLHKNDGYFCVLFDADSSETRKRWLIAISYQLAFRSPMMNFAPFAYAPPMGDAVHRLILCGDILKQGLTRINWSTYFFRLTPSELKYTVVTSDVKGAMQLEGATVRSEDMKMEITITSKTGVILIIKADDQRLKDIWIKAIQSQITNISDRIKCLSWAIPAEERAMGPSQEDLGPNIPDDTDLEIDVLEKKDLGSSIAIPSVVLLKAFKSSKRGNEENEKSKEKKEIKLESIAE